jgi:hypothetical protein
MVYMKRVSYFECSRIHSHVPESWGVLMQKLFFFSMGTLAVCIFASCALCGMVATFLSPYKIRIVAKMTTY